MKYTHTATTLLVVILAITAGCKQAQTPHTHIEDAEPAMESLSFTIHSTYSELFVEFPPLIVGQEVKFITHFTDMLTFKSIDEGTVSVILHNTSQNAIQNEVTSASSPGIFRPAITPSTPGYYSLDFIISTPRFQDTFSMADIFVYSDEKSAIEGNPLAPESNDVSFSKEQAWNIDFALSTVKLGSIHEVIHTSGEIQPVKGQDKVVAAKTSGLVYFKSSRVEIGREVKSSEQLFSISSEGLLQTNIGQDYKVAEARHAQAQADFERSEELLEQQIIGKKEYERRKMVYAVIDAQFQNLNSSYHDGGQSVNAPMTGIIKNVFVSDGQFVNEGDPLVKITQSRRLLLTAHVSQRFLPQLPLIETANFKTSYQESVQSLDRYNGKLVSYGNMIEEETGFIPVLFELDNVGELIPGSFVELFLLTKPIDNTLVIPKSALLEEYGSYFVYLQTGGESFAKRQVKLGVDDGIHVQVISGLFENEWVVSTGAYQVKMASMSSTIPAHGHAH